MAARWGTGGTASRWATRRHRHGLNRLLWAAQADADHPVGTVERVAPDLVRGFIAPPVNGDLGSFIADGWLTVCRGAYAILRPQPAQTET